jgi:hypothetical protein
MAHGNKSDRLLQLSNEYYAKKGETEKTNKYWTVMTVNVETRGEDTEQVMQFLIKRITLKHVRRNDI